MENRCGRVFCAYQEGLLLEERKESLKAISSVPVVGRVAFFLVCRSIEEQQKRLLKATDACKNCPSKARLPIQK